MEWQRSGASRRSVLGLMGAVPVAAAGAVVAGSGLASAESSRHGRVPKAMRPGGEYDRYVAERARADEFSGTILVAYGGKPVLERAYGMADKEKSLRNRTDTLFILGSINKSFTATALLQLVQQGKVDLRAKLGTYLDGFPAEIADTVTVHQLLTHTSGVGRSPIQIGPPDPEELAWDTVEEVWEGTLKIIRARPLQFTPGTKWQYSNDGFTVLGAIVAEVSGQSYYDYVRENVFAPAGMKRTDFYTRPQVLAADDIAHSYATRNQTGEGERYDFTTSERFQFVGLPAGGAFSTAGELLKFVMALREDGTLLKKAFAELATSGKAPDVPSDEEPDPLLQCTHYGYGFATSIFNSQRIFGHTGGGPGTGNSYNVYPDLDCVSVILGNYDSAKGSKPMLRMERRLVTN
ncbi:beta-lactamase family protein [Nonomuraea sp. K274]|uniref:Beta-lactamase family protein n=1 Tax=Nonomuraea cypriaca TaxID=1187855 RepID=A0A931A746_9ACTN|nr:serine hydrolase domain-containing protein [Nonomuraea cypriaca]MBF8184634.1 beta-lactamase family protein [Nonomuraea cypriaca]